MIRWLLIMLLSSVGMRCNSDSEQSRLDAVQQALARPTIRDSSGVRIIEYPTLGAGTAWNNNRTVNPLALQLNQLPPALRMAERPFLEIGGLQSDSAQEFDARTPLLSTVTLSSGTVVVKDHTRLMYFGADGRLLRSAGRAGRGPGEFTQTRDLCLLTGDRVMVINLGDQRIAVFDGDGRLLQAAARPGRMPNGGCTPEGHVVIRDASMTEEQSDTIDFLVPHRIVKLDGSTVTAIGLLPAQSIGRMNATTPNVVINEDEIFVGNGRTFEIKVYDRAGKLKRISRLLRLTPPITDHEWKAQLERNRPMGSPEAIARFKHNFLTRKPLRFPSFSQLRVDPSHRLWVSDYQSNSSWTVFDRSGLLLGRFELDWRADSRRELAGFGPDYVVIQYRDSAGAQHLAFQRILQ